MHHRFKPNVGKYSIHGASGICLWKLLESLPGALQRLLLVHDMAAVGLEFEQFPITQHNPSIKLTRVNPETQKPEQEIACNLQDFQHNQFMMLRKKISDSRIKKYMAILSIHVKFLGMYLNCLAMMYLSCGFSGLGKATSRGFCTRQ